MNTEELRKFTAGDRVHHKQTDEAWILACDEERGEVLPCGWPMCSAKAADCVLVQAATESERVDMLRTWSEKKDSESNRDWRAIRAKGQFTHLPK